MKEIKIRDAMPDWYNTLTDLIRELKEMDDPRITSLLSKYHIEVTNDK